MIWENITAVSVNQEFLTGWNVLNSSYYNKMSKGIKAFEQKKI